jgi:hypothetical protein
MMAPGPRIFLASDGAMSSLPRCTPEAPDAAAVCTLSSTKSTVPVAAQSPATDSTSRLGIRRVFHAYLYPAASSGHGVIDLPDRGRGVGGVGHELEGESAHHACSRGQYMFACSGFILRLPDIAQQRPSGKPCFTQCRKVCRSNSSQRYDPAACQMRPEGA